MDERFSPSDEYAAASLIEVARMWSEGWGLRQPIAELPQICYNLLGLSFSDDEIDNATRLLVELEVGEIITSERARPYFRIAPEFFSSTGRTGAQLTFRMGENFPILQAYLKVGRDWLVEAASAAQQHNSGDGPAEPTTVEIPASDRVVSLDHNAEAVIQIRSQAQNLRQKIMRGNDLGGFTEEQAKAAANEVFQLEQMLEAPVVRPEAFMSAARRSLKWIADKAGDTLIGAAATALLALIANYFGYVI